MREEDGKVGDGQKLYKKARFLHYRAACGVLGGEGTSSPGLELELQPDDSWLQLLKLARALHTAGWGRILYCLLWLADRYEWNLQRGRGSVTDSPQMLEKTLQLANTVRTK